MGRKSKRARQATEQRRRGGQRYEKYLSASSADQLINEISPNTTSLTMTSIENDEWTPEIHYEGEDIGNEEDLFSPVEIKQDFEAAWQELLKWKEIDFRTNFRSPKYSGNSSRTKQRRASEQKKLKIAAKSTTRIDSFFPRLEECNVDGQEKGEEDIIHNSDFESFSDSSDAKSSRSKAGWVIS